VNVIGEHTDYNGGFVLPMAIPQRTVVELAPTDGDTVRAWSAELGEPRPVEYVVGRERRGRGWLDYLQGVTWVLRDDGHPIRGFDVRIASAVPIGAGLASSAALEVALLRALRGAFALALDDAQLALVGQRAENEFVGARTGVMDQMAASLGDDRSCLLLDTRSLRHERIPLPPGIEPIVVDSGVAHRHATGAYNARREECERACTLLGVSQLRELTPADLPRLAALPAPLARRARHVVTENARVLAAAEALRTGDLEQLGMLLHAGHVSLRDDYEVSIPEIDALVELAAAEPAVVGARLTGGGFGGAVIMLAHAGAGRAAAARIGRRYALQSGRTARLVVPTQRS
jgi:galactokinase